MRSTREQDQQHWQRVDEIFNAVLETPSGEQAARLEVLCGSDGALRADVSRLLLSDGRVEVGFLEPPAALAAAAPPNRIGAGAEVLQERPGTVIGSYTLQEQIGEGGFGVVYLAEQHKPIRRRLSLKIIKPGMDTRQVVARFQAERQALSLMDHPHIARVFDAGATDSGRPYFVMELVKGIIHRDLKPSNVMIAMKDGRPAPKVIDFGVAKAINQQLTEHTLYTQFAQMVGTPLYMSPEQAEMSQLEVDTRSDIYSLGALLYELLTGTTPFERERLTKASFDELRRIIRQDEPPKPSTRLSTMGDGSRLAGIAQHRRTDPRRLHQPVRGDLDWIVMKALEKDRTRRYDTASALATDVQRYLDDEPVEACPPSVGYRWRKFVRRHKVGATLAAVFVLLVTVSSVGSTVLWRRAVAAEMEQSRERRRAEQAEASARAEAQAARDVSASLANLFQSLDPWSAAGSPESGGGFTVLELLDREVRALPEKLKNQPLAQADVLIAIASVYYRMELFGRASTALRSALELRRRALEFQHVLVAQAASDLGWMLRCKGEFVAAEPFLRDALTIWRHHAPTNPNQQLPSPGTLTELSRVLCAQGRFAEAELVDREALDIYRGMYGADEVNFVTGLRTVSITRRLAGDGAGAEALCREALAACARLTDECSLHEFRILLELSAALRDQGRFLEAEESAREALDRAAGWEDGNEAQAMLVAAALMRARGDLDGSEALDRKSLETFRKYLGPDHPAIAMLGMTYRLLPVQAEKGDRLGLEALHQEFLTQYQRALALPEDHPLRSGAALHLGHLKLYQGDAVGAEPLLREAIELRRAALSAEHWLSAYAEGVLGECLTALGRHSEAEPLLLGAERLLRTQLGRMEYRSIHVLRGLTKLYEAWEAAEPGQGYADEAAEWRAELEEWQVTTQSKEPNESPPVHVVP